jgi:hypothetical protein|tara:strand:+ start:1478 stop:1714 length:237 start_codon:yes stop_codon:yes gene_type:complete
MIKQCAQLCKDKKVSCPNTDCKMWIDFEEDLNCANISVVKHGSMTLRQVAEREHLSFVRIQQIEKRVLKKLKARLINK